MEPARPSAGHVMHQDESTLEPLLVHACCGPCATVARERFPSYRPVLYFYNPNVTPREEYLRRLESARALAEADGMELVEGPYDPEAWRAAVSPHDDGREGGTRCRACFAFRLEGAARFAAENGFSRFSTTLTVSPHKRSADIFAAGARAALPGQEFVATDLKKRDGFGLSVRRTRELDLHRQSYCGCLPTERPAE